MLYDDINKCSIPGIDAFSIFIFGAGGNSEVPSLGFRHDRDDKWLCAADCLERNGYFTRPCPDGLNTLNTLEWVAGVAPSDKHGLNCRCLHFSAIFPTTPFSFITAFLPELARYLQVTSKREYRYRTVMLLLKSLLTTW